MKNITDKLNDIEDSAIDVLAFFGPWLAPIPSAYLVEKSAQVHLEWHWVVAWLAAAAVEIVGVVSVVMALRLYEWNETRNKTDVPAPFNLAIVNVVVYFIVTIGLTVMLDVVPSLAMYAPAIFPFLAAVGAVNIAIKNGQRRREKDKKQAKMERQQERKKDKPPEARQPVNLSTVNHPATVDELTPAQRRLFDAMKENPSMSQSDIAALLGVSRQAVSKQIKAMNGVMSEGKL